MTFNVVEVPPRYSHCRKENSFKQCLNGKRKHNVVEKTKAIYFIHKNNIVVEYILKYYTYRTKLFNTPSSGNKLQHTFIAIKTAGVDEILYTYIYMYLPRAH